MAAGNPFQKRRPNERLAAFPHQIYNAIIDATASARGERAGFTGGAGGGPYDPALTDVRNDTGNPLPSFAVVGLTAPLVKPTDNLSEFQSRLAWSSGAPGSIISLLDPGAVGAGMRWVVPPGPNPAHLYVRADDNGSWIDAGDAEPFPYSDSFAITLQPLGAAVGDIAGRIGKAVMYGRVAARLLISNLNDQVAGISLGDTERLETGTLGASIAWRDNPPTWGTITNAVDNGSGLIRLTATAHNIENGAVVNVYGIAGTTEANGYWQITKIDENTLDLNSSTFNNTYTAGGTFILVTTNVTESDVDGSGTITVTSPDHHLVNGDQVDLSITDPGNWNGQTKATLIVDVADDDKITLRNADDYADEVTDDDGNSVTDDDNDDVYTIPEFGTCTKIIWSVVTLKGSSGGFTQVLTDVACTSAGLQKTYGYVQ